VNDQEQDDAPMQEEEEGYDDDDGASVQPQPVQGQSKSAATRKVAPPMPAAQKHRPAPMQEEGEEYGDEESDAPGAAVHSGGALQTDYRELLNQMQGDRRGFRIPAPPRETLDNLGQWGGLVLGGAGKLAGLVVNPVNRLMDFSANDSDGEYMSFTARMTYRLVGLVVLVWDALLTQAVTSHIFPEVDKAVGTVGSADFFKNGITIGLKAFIASLIFTGILSICQNMLFDKNKSTFKKLLIVGAFTVNVVFDCIGYADFWDHSARFEWIMLRQGQIEWGSVVIYIASILTAPLPELAWHKARHARKMTSPQSAHQQQPPRPAQQQPQQTQNGAYVNTPNGMKWLPISQIKKLAEEQRRREGGR